MIPLIACVAAIAAADRVEYIGAATIPADATDLSGLTDILRGDCPNNRLGGLGSGIAWSGREHRYLALPDRGPSDGLTAYRSRVQELSIVVDPAAPLGERVKVDLRKTILLSREDGSPLIGDQGAVGRGDGDAMGAARFDCEGIAIASDGTMFISDEYGPCVDHFSADGRRIGRTLAPAKFLNPRSNVDPAQEMPPHATTGRQNNRGMEGLTFTADRTHLMGMMQSPLLQDGALDEAGKRAGFNVRMIEMPLDAGQRATAGREFVYRLETGGTGVNEILAINDHEYLVLERDSTFGADAKFRWIFRIDVSGATDVSGVDQLPQGELPAEIKPVRKRQFMDLMNPSWNLAGTDGSGMPEKIEGLTWGPDLPDGRRLLIVTSDNDFSATIPTFVWAFAVAKKD